MAQPPDEDPPTSTPDPAPGAATEGTPDPEPATASPLISWTPSGGGPPAGSPSAVVPPTAAGTTGWQLPPDPAPDADAPDVMAGVGVRLVAWLVDLLIIGAVAALILIAIAGTMMDGTPEDLTTANILFAILVTGLEFLYFVGFWTGGAAATPGMRLLSLRIASTRSRGGLGIGQAAVRWAAFGYPLTLLTVVDAAGQFASWALTAWSVVLLLTTILSDTNRGLHDRWSGTVIVQRAGARVNGALVGCLVAALVLVVLFILLPIVALALLGDQLQVILSEVGQSI